jgi:hypothetical protein
MSLKKFEIPVTVSVEALHKDLAKACVEVSMLAVTEFLRQGGLYKILTLIVGFQGMPLR